MAQELVRQITPSRISIQVDHIAYVIDLKEGQVVEDVVADFMVAFRKKKARENSEVAVVLAGRQKAALAARGQIAVEAAALTPEEIAKLTAPRAATKFDFPGFDEDNEPTPAPVKAPVTPAAVKKPPAGMQATAAA